MDLRVPPIQHQRSIRLRNRNISKRLCLNRQLVARLLPRVILRMPQEVEICRVREGWRDRQSRCTSPRRGCRPTSRRQERWRYFKEIRLKLLLRVLLAVDAAVLADRGRVIV